MREDLGYPIMVTPFSQFVSSQATLNVIVGKRYDQVSDEVIQFAGGHWGAEAASYVKPEVRDLILSHPRAKGVLRGVDVEPDLADIRRRYGQDVSDEELLLRYIAPAREVAAMHAAGSPKSYPLAARTMVGFTAELIGKRQYQRIRVRKGDKTVSISSGSPTDSAHV